MNAFLLLLAQSGRGWAGWPGRAGRWDSHRCSALKLLSAGSGPALVLFGPAHAAHHAPAQGKLLALDLLVRVLTNPMHDWGHMRPEFAGKRALGWQAVD